MQIFYNKKANFREIIKSVLLNPILDAMFLGLLAAKLGLHTLLAASSLEEAYTRGMQILSTVMTYGLLFMIGFLVSGSHFLPPPAVSSRRSAGHPCCCCPAQSQA